MGASESSTSTLLRPLYALADKLKRIEISGGKEFRVVPSAIVAPQMDGIRNLTIIYWPIVEYTAAFIAWNEILKSRGITIMEWPLGDGTEAMTALTAAKNAPNDDKLKTEAFNAVSALPSLLTARQTLDDSLRKIDPYYAVRSKMRYWPWIIGISAAAVGAALFISRRERRTRRSVREIDVTRNLPAALLPPPPG